MKRFLLLLLCLYPSVSFATMSAKLFYDIYKTETNDEIKGTTIYTRGVIDGIATVLSLEKGDTDIDKKMFYCIMMQEPEKVKERIIRHYLDGEIDNDDFPATNIYTSSLDFCVKKIKQGKVIIGEKIK